VTDKPQSLAWGLGLSSSPSKVRSKSQGAEGDASRTAVIKPHGDGTQCSSRAPAVVTPKVTLKVAPKIALEEVPEVTPEVVPEVAVARDSAQGSTIGPP